NGVVFPYGGFVGDKPVTGKWAGGPDFGVSFDSVICTHAVLIGNPATCNVNVTGINGYTGTVNLSASSPTFSASLSPTTVSVGHTATLTFTAPLGTAVGTNYSITITGTVGQFSHTAMLSVSVSDFSLALSSQSPASIQPGSSATYTLSAAAIGVPAGSVYLS